MRKWLNNYLDFSKSEFNGIMLLMGLIGLVTISPYIYKQLYTDQQNEEYPVTKHIVFNNQADHPEQPITNNNQYQSVREPVNKARSYRMFYFDPNTATQLDWQELGLSAKQAASIVKYVSKGGKFKQSSDLRKMYTVNEEFYNRVVPYVKINNSDTGPTKALNAVVVKHVEPEVVEINTADSTALLKIKGVGPVFASRILRYRDRVGGYYSKQQLKEVYGIDSTKFTEIADQVMVDAAKLKKININTAKVEDFKNHPYIKYKQANAIIQYRNQHGNYNSISDLSKILNISPETVSKLAPYLVF